MMLLIIHGAPASGKLTIAKEVGARLGYGVLHNHLTVDLALQVYPEFGSEDFFEFVDSVRTLCIKKACDNKVNGLIVTLCYDTILDKACINKWVYIVEDQGGKVLPIYLTASLNALKTRVSNESRSGTYKIATAEQLVATLSQYNFGPIELPLSCEIDTDTLSVQESVNKILEIIL